MRHTQAKLWEMLLVTEYIERKKEKQLSTKWEENNIFY